MASGMLGGKYAAKPKHSRPGWYLGRLTQSVLQNKEELRLREHSIEIHEGAICPAIRKS